MNYKAWFHVAGVGSVSADMRAVNTSFEKSFDLVFNAQHTSRLLQGTRTRSYKGAFTLEYFYNRLPSETV